MFLVPICQFSTMSPKAKFVLLMLAMTFLILDGFGLLGTSIAGRILNDQNKMKDSYFIYFLIPIYIALFAKLFQIFQYRIGMMIDYCHLFTVGHLFGDLGIYAMEFLIVLGICVSLIQGEVFTYYKFDVVVLVFCIFKFFAWLRNVVGGFTDVGYYNGNFIMGKHDLKGTDDEIKKIRKRGTFLFKQDGNGMTINNINLTQIADFTRLFISITGLTIWTYFDDTEKMASTLYKVYIAAMAFAGINVIYHAIILGYMKRKFGSEFTSNEMIRFLYSIIFMIQSAKGFVVGTLIGTMYGVASYLNDPTQPDLFNHAISLAILYITKMFLWLFMFAKSHHMGSKKPSV